MRTIKDLTGNDEKVWVYLSDEAVWKKFVGMAENEEFHFGELPAEKWTFGYVISVHRNGDMGHLPLFVWWNSFTEASSKVPLKVDFLKYINSDEKYLCTRSHFNSAIIRA